MRGRGGSGGFWFWAEAQEGVVAGAALGVEGKEGWGFGFLGFGGFGAGRFRREAEFGREVDAEEAGEGAQGAAEGFQGWRMGGGEQGLGFRRAQEVFQVGGVCQ